MLKQVLIRMPKPWSRMLTVCLACAVIAGCGSSSSSSSSDESVTTGDDPTPVDTGSYLVIDLETWSVAAHDSIPDLATNQQYRDRYLVFVDTKAAAVATIGSTISERWHLGGQTSTTAHVPRAFVAVFETTRAQWRRIVGTEPWTAYRAELVGSGDDLPAVGMSQLDAIDAATLASRQVTGSVGLPPTEAWEIWCRAGSDSQFSWGSDITPSLAAQYAETAGSSLSPMAGPIPVGSRAPNAYGIYDMHGNVWEWTINATIHGGSWRDDLPMARAANEIEVDPITAHPLAGIRLVYVPNDRDADQPPTPVGTIADSF